MLSKSLGFAVTRHTKDTPGNANLRLFRDFSGYFEPFGNSHTFPIQVTQTPGVGPLWNHVKISMLPRLQ